MKILLPLLVALPLFAIESQTVHSSLLGYTQYKKYTNSKQKIDGRVYGIGGDIHYGKNALRFAYEDGAATTKKPPLTTDLTNQKLFLRYRYRLTNKLYFHLNYLTVLYDNIAITSGGKGYGGGVEYLYNKQLSSSFTQYFVQYSDFKTYQSDLKLNYKTTLNAVKMQLSLLGKYIKLQDIHQNSFTCNAKNHYTTAGVKIHMHYKSYHFVGGAYFGKRVFAVMNDGFKLQHHAMEFNRTYALGVGKTFNKFIARVQYAYNRATELPINNPDVKITNITLMLNYKL
jgi:hypothetical protein